MDTQNNMPEQTMNNIQNLQNLEKELYIKLQGETKNNDKDRQSAIIQQINDISQTRINMFEQLKSVYQLLDNNFENDRTNLANKLTTISVVEKNLNNSKEQLNKLRDNNVNALRMAEIDTFFSNKYNAYLKIIQFFIFLMIPVVLIVVLKRNQTISLQTTNVLIAVIIVIGLIFIGGSLLDLSKRNNMAFQEYDFPLNVSNSTQQSVIEYDLEQLGFLKEKVESEFDSLGNSLTECVGADCCSKNMIFDTKKGICEPKPSGNKSSESFLSGQQNSGALY